MPRPANLPPIHILFMGNSHTVTNDVPGMVDALIESNGERRQVATRCIVGADLNAVWRMPQASETIAGRSFSHLVLQGAAISSSHKYTYSQEGPIGLAKAGLTAGMRVFLFAEWPRKGWKESDYILGIYGKTVAAAKGCEVVPVPQAWDRAVAKRPDLPLWSADGNHAALPGSYLAACVIAERIAGLGKSEFTPRGLEPKLASWLRDVARATMP
jgi:hypothetical protein